jgi:hypothetical protein
VVVASPAKFCGEAAALGAQAAPMGSRGRREAVKRLQGGRGDGEERGGGQERRSALFFKVARWRGAKRKRERGVGAGVPRGRGRRKERRGPVRGRQLNCVVRMALGGAVGRGSAHSRQGPAGEQGRAAGCGRRGASVTNRRDRGEAGPGGQRSGCERERERERQSGRGAPTCRPGRRGSKLI